MNANTETLVEISETELAQVTGGDYDDNENYRPGEIVEGADGRLMRCVEDFDGSMYFEDCNDF